MATIRLALLLSVACFAASPAPLRAQEPGSLLGTWRTAPGAEPEETVTFRADQTLRVQESTLRYAVEGSRLQILGESSTVRGTWQVHGDELVLSLEVSGERTRTGIYRRAHDIATLRLERIAFEVPAGWTIARESADAALLNPGLAATETLDALVILMHGTLERRASLEQAVRAKLTELAAELRQQATVADFRDPVLRRVKTTPAAGTTS